MTRRHASVPLTWVRYRDALRMFVRGVTIRSAVQIALVVGTWLSLVNQGHLIVQGDPPWLKIALNYATPFVVSSLGFLAGLRRLNFRATAATVTGETDRTSTRQI